MVLFCAVFETVYDKCYQNITSRLDPKPQEVKRSNLETETGVENSYTFVVRFPIVTLVSNLTEICRRDGT